MSKSPDAFRTISEVADWLGVQAHVLRFWESKFAQVKPIKRAGGRRYYRPADMLLLGGIKKILHDDGMTIKGAQKLLREHGVAYVADQSQPLDDLTMAVIETSPAAVEEDPQAMTPPANPVEENDIQEASSDVEEAAAEPEAEEVAQSTTAAEAVEKATADAPKDSKVTPAPQNPPEITKPPLPDIEETQAVTSPQVAAKVEAEADTPEPVATASRDEEDTSLPEQAAVEETVATAQQDAPAETAAETEADAPAMMPSFRARSRTPAPEPVAEPTPAPEPVENLSEDTQAPEHTEAPTDTDQVAAREPEYAEAPLETPSDTGAAPEPLPEATLRPRVVDIPALPPISEIQVAPAALSALARVRKLSPEMVREIKPHIARLTRLRASMANPRKETHKD